MLISQLVTRPGRGEVRLQVTVEVICVTTDGHRYEVVTAGGRGKSYGVVARELGADPFEVFGSHRQPEDGVELMWYPTFSGRTSTS